MPEALTGEVVQEQALNFFTPGSIATFGGASLAIWAVCNTFCTFVNVDKKYPAIVTSMGIAMMGAYTAETLLTIPGFLLALLNGCLLFCSSAGFQAGAIAMTTPKPKDGPKPHGLRELTRRQRFMSPWFKSPPPKQGEEKSKPG